MRTRIAVTLGDPRGIGPEVAFQAVAGELPPGVDLTFFGSDALGPQVPAGCDFVSVGGFDGSEQDAGNVSVLAIQRAVESAMRGEYRALVTAPASRTGASSVVKVRRRVAGATTGQCLSHELDKY